MAVQITQAATSDIEELNKLSIASKMHWNYPEEWMEKWKADLALTEKDFSTHSIFKLTEASGSILGFCAIKEYANKYEVVHLWVKPAHMGKGYGKQLLNESIKRIVVKEKPVIVEADPNAERFYLSQGFITFSKRESFPAGRFLPLMRKAAPARVPAGPGELVKSS